MNRKNWFLDIKYIALNLLASAKSSDEESDPQIAQIFADEDGMFYE